MSTPPGGLDEGESVSTNPQETTAATVAGLIDAGLLVRADDASTY
ncbi:hypothetical protein [Streptomyces roseolus]